MVNTMAVDFNDVVKQGYVKMKSKNLGVWQKRWIILRAASSKGTCRLEKFLDEKAANHSSYLKMIDLSDVKTICRLPTDVRKYGVTLYFKDEASRQFSCESDLECDEWIKVLNQECLGKSAIINGEPDLLDSGWQREMSERYHVYVIPNPNLDWYGECLMQVTGENIHLYDVRNRTAKLMTWPLTSLRRYGRDHTKFTFEATRVGQVGEGLYLFSTTQGENIYYKVHQSALAIAESHRRAMERLQHRDCYDDDCRERYNQNEHVTNYHICQKQTNLEREQQHFTPQHRGHNRVYNQHTSSGHSKGAECYFPDHACSDDSANANTQWHQPVCPATNCVSDDFCEVDFYDDSSTDGEEHDYEEIPQASNNLSSQFRQYLHISKDSSS
ncbi:docking protein 5-like [Tubulanus polymorphus]|uniref:docking protein 5-like n=1 Tax=Tubulanus polymorphus TaxID=672921 RepID=UPI003DA2766E